MPSLGRIGPATGQASTLRGRPGLCMRAARQGQHRVSALTTVLYRRSCKAVGQMQLRRHLVGHFLGFLGRFAELVDDRLEVFPSFYQALDDREVRSGIADATF